MEVTEERNVLQKKLILPFKKITAPLPILMLSFTLLIAAMMIMQIHCKGREMRIWIRTFCLYCQNSIKYSRLLTWQSHSTPEYSSIPNSTPFAETPLCLDPHSPVFVINQTANAKNVLIGVNVKTLRPTAFDVYQSPSSILSNIYFQIFAC